MQTDNRSHKHQWLHCHISSPDKAVGNCYVKKIMLTLRIILSLSEYFFFSRGAQSVLSEKELGEDKHLAASPSSLMAEKC